MKIDKKKLVREYTIVATTRLEDIADFDGRYYTLKDFNSELNKAIRTIKLDRKGRIRDIKLHGT